MTRSSRRSNSGLLLVLATLASASGSALAAGPGAVVVDRIVAVVNDQIILLSELDQQAAPFEERAAHGSNDPVGRALALKQVRQKTLDDMVADKLVESQAN